MSIERITNRHQQIRADQFTVRRAQAAAYGVTYFVTYQTLNPRRNGTFFLKSGEYKPMNQLSEAETKFERKVMTEGAVFVELLEYGEDVEICLRRYCNLALYRQVTCEVGWVLGAVNPPFELEVQAQP